MITEKSAKWHSMLTKKDTTKASICDYAHFNGICIQNMDNGKFVRKSVVTGIRIIGSWKFLKVLVLLE